MRKSALVVIPFLALILLSARMTVAADPEEQTATVNGAVTDKAGQPIANVIVTLSGQGGVQMPGPGIGETPQQKLHLGQPLVFLQGKPGLSNLRAKTDEKGNYNIVKVKPGDYIYTAGNKTVGQTHGSAHINVGTNTLNIQLPNTKQQ